MTFSYNYSPAVNKEVAEIRKKYLPQEESKLQKLQRLDSKVQTAGMPESLSCGILGCLLFGISMCMGLSVLPGGIVTAVLLAIPAIAGMLAAYPVYQHCYQKVKTALVPEILKLADEIDGEN